MIAPARVAAYEALLSLSAGRADLPALLAQKRLKLADERDRALTAEIVTGVQRRRPAIDFIVSRVANRPIDRMDPEVIEILRAGAYQLLYLTRVPASAVVDDAVSLARRAGKSSAAGFVNAVLRTVSRKRSSLRLPGRPAQPADRQGVLEYFSISLSHPRWLAARWLDRYGFEATERWLAFDNEAAPLTLRHNRLRCTRDQLVNRLETAGVVVTAGRYSPEALIVRDGHPLRLDVAEQGWFFVQDEASQLVPLLAGRLPGPAILDTCASPGGKTTALAASAVPGSRIVACDVRDRRMALLRRTILTSGAPNVTLVEADLLAPLPFRRPFDLVMVDAPCSGIGTLRRDPDIKWRRSESDLDVLAASQLTMLRHAAAMVANGGRLVYSTCSSEPEENESVVDAFLETDDFEQVDLSDEGLLPPETIDARGFFRTLPHVHGLEAFFGAAFQRR